VDTGATSTQGVVISAVGWIVIGVAAWLVVALIVGVLIGRMIRRRDAQVPRSETSAAPGGSEAGGHSVAGSRAVGRGRPRSD
jgi:hypothetical protein